MHKFLSILGMALFSAMLVSCTGMTNQDVGTLSGAAAGGLLGSTIGGGNGKLIAVAAGTLAGAYLGGSIGKSMDQSDRTRVNHALESNPIGEPAYWHNANTGATYKVVPTRNVTLEGNRYCREYRTTATIAGRQQQVYGTACRQPDGSWQAVSNN